MDITPEVMDAAILRFRSFPNAEAYQTALQEPEFRTAIEAAYARDPSFFTVDADGWRPTQFCADVPPARPPTTSWLENEATRKNDEKYRPKPPELPPGITNPERFKKYRNE